MDIANAGIGKLKDVLKKVSVVETIIWILVGIVALILFFTGFDKDSVGVGIVVVAGIVILLGIISGIILYFATQKDGKILYQTWFVDTLILLICLIVGIILAGILLGNNTSSVGGWIAIFCFIILLPIKSYLLYLVWKFYKWNNRAGVVNAVASAFS